MKHYIVQLMISIKDTDELDWFSDWDWDRLINPNNSRFCLNTPVQFLSACELPVIDFPESKDRQEVRDEFMPYEVIKVGEVIWDGKPYYAIADTEGNCLKCAFGSDYDCNRRCLKSETEFGVDVYYIKKEE